MRRVLNGEGQASLLAVRVGAGGGLDEDQAVAADRDTSARARRMCVISLCTRAALDTWSRGR
jgi:hypothetical protein